MKQVKEVLNAVISRFKEGIDLFHLTSATSDSLTLINGLDAISQSILLFKDLIPMSNMDHLLIDELLLNNFLKAIGKKVHRIAAVDSQTTTTTRQEQPIETAYLEPALTKVQLAFDYVMSEKQLKNYILDAFSQRPKVESVIRLRDILREMSRGDKGLQVDPILLQ